MVNVISMIWFPALSTLLSMIANKSIMSKEMPKIFSYHVFSTITRCPVLYRTVRYLGLVSGVWCPVSGIKIEAIPYMHLSSISDLPLLFPNS